MSPAKVWLMTTPTLTSAMISLSGTVNVLETKVPEPSGMSSGGMTSMT